MKFEPIRSQETSPLGNRRRAWPAPSSAQGSPADQPRFILGSIASGAGPIPSIEPELGARDRLGAVAVRLGIGRNRYRVEPGLYAVGSPTSDSPVLVSANYKLSFDCLRKELCGIDAWILVLDTKGINVWCSAGKGTFGNAELEGRIAMTRLGLVVQHRELILPQLSATGVSAPAFRRSSGWNIRFGPVEARDIPAYLAAGKRKNEAMRHIDFPLIERLKLVPLEIVRPLSRFVLLLVAWTFAAFAGRLVGDNGAAQRNLVGLAYSAFVAAWSAWLPILGALVVGTGLVPAFLPWIPFRAFSAKGAILGLCYAIITMALTRAGAFEALALLLALPAISAWFALNFTGSSTYTSLAGVKAEITATRIPILVCIALGLGLRTILLLVPGA